MKPIACFPLKPVYSAVLLALGGLSLSPAYAASTGGCNNYTPTTGQTVTCTSSVTPAATSGIQTTLNDTGNNNVTVNVNNGAVLSFQGSPIGIGSASTVTNAGTLNSGTFYWGYGISFGANGRSDAGGNTVNNAATGLIQTAGTNASGIYINASNGSAAASNIVNAGTILTSGGFNSQDLAGSSGIRLINDATTDSISNTGSITSQKNFGIYVKGSADITSSGSISGLTKAIYFDPSTTNILADSVTLQSGATINGSIAFNTNKTSETLVFDGLTNSNFNNGVTGANIVRAINGAAVTMSSSGGYAFGVGQVNVDGASALTISGVVKDDIVPTSINKTGTGTLTLSGANTYSGGTTVSAGTLAGNTTSLQGNILNNAAVSFNQTADGTYSSIMSGTGSLNKIGTGTLTLSGANTYSGGTTVSGGTLAGNTRSLQGNILNNAAVIFNQNAAGTYAGVMSGTGSLTKTGSDTLTLAGANTYSGGTTVSAGTLAGNTTSLQGNILNNAAVMFNQSAAGTYAGVMSGTGSLTKTGAGSLTLSGVNTYTGDTLVQAGVMNLTGSITSNTTVSAAANLQGSGTIIGSLTNAGNVQPATGSIKTNLTVTGNYVGQGGTFTTNTYSPSNAVTADTLTVGGSASGSTQIIVKDSGALGQATTGNGILLVSAAASTAGAFQTGRVAAGAYEYKLVQTGGSWYLKTSDNSVPTAPPSQPEPPGQPVTPQAGQRVETALYPALPTLARMYALNVVDSYDQRRGDLALLSDGGANRKSGAAWGRLMGKMGQSDPSSATFGPMLKSRTYGVQVGLDLVNQSESNGGQTFIGPFATFGQASGRVSSQSGAMQTGSVSLNAYSGGLNATHITKDGHYIDALVQGTYFENATANSLVSTAISTQGGGLTASLEGGYKLAVTKQISLTPQLQVIYNLNSLKNSTDAYSLVNMPNDSATLGRVGFKLSHNGEFVGSEASNVWARVSGLSMLSGANTQTSFSNLAGTNSTMLNTQAPTSWMAFDIGANKVISGNHLVYLNAGYESALSTMYQSGYVKGGYTYRF